MKESARYANSNQPPLGELLTEYPAGQYLDTPPSFTIYPDN
jgi:hypothetical protein